MIIGPSEAGKTTFTAALANTLHARGLRVAIVDADVGQSEIGPPGTVGLGAVAAPIERTGDAEIIRFEFIGRTSPGRQPWRTAEATARLVAAAREFDRVVVDTSGFVDGGFGASLKQRKIAGADPDAVVLVQHADECEHIVRGLSTRARLVRLPALTGVTTRTPAARRRHRDAALARHLEGARPVTLSTSRVDVRSLAGAEVAPGTIAPMTVVALHDGDGNTLALGVVDSADAGGLIVRTTLRASAVARVTVGEMTAG